MRRLAFVVNNIDFLLSHRRGLVLGAVAAGYDVHVIAPPAPTFERIEALGATVHAWALDRKSQNPLDEVGVAARLAALYRKLRPDVVHHVTIKPVLYGSAAARLVGVRGVVNAVSGLGYIFLAEGRVAALRRMAIARAYRAALSGEHSAVILQNDDDEADLRKLGALPPSAHVVKIRGSGVDLSKFSATPLPTGVPLVVLPARLLRDKGVVEFVDAARALKAKVSARFALVGDLDAGNPAGISREELDGWVAAGDVEWWGFQPDIAAVFRQASIVCLPSYREGMSKALLEAAACGRPIVTTDAPGCRDAVDFGRLGPLVPVRDSAALASALLGLLQNSAQRDELGTQLRAFAVRNFDERQVVARHLDVWGRVGP